MSIDIDIDRGRIGVNVVIHVIDRPDVHVFEIDLISKYPGQPQWLENAAGDGMDVFLLHTSRTRDLDRTATRDTLIRFTGFDARNFTAIAEASRYTARIAFYRRKVS